MKILTEKRVEDEPNMNPVVVLQRLNDHELERLTNRSENKNLFYNYREEVLEFEEIDSVIFECPFCDFEGFTKEELLTKHLIKSHKVSKKKPKVNNWNDSVEVATLFRLLKIPVTSSESGSRKRYQCFVCALAFDRKDTLSFHLDNVHSKEEPNNPTNSLTLDLQTTDFSGMKFINRNQ